MNSLANSARMRLSERSMGLKSSACGTLSKDCSYFKLFAFSCNQHTRRDGLMRVRCPAAGQAMQCKRREARDIPRCRDRSRLRTGPVTRMLSGNEPVMERLRNHRRNVGYASWRPSGSRVRATRSNYRSSRAGNWQRACARQRSSKEIISLSTAKRFGPALRKMQHICLCW